MTENIFQDKNLNCRGEQQRNLWPWQMKIMKEAFREYDDQIQFKPTDKQKKASFVPIEEAPDDRPDPSEALMLKEDKKEQKTNKKEAPKDKKKIKPQLYSHPELQQYWDREEARRKKAGLHAIDRAPSYLEEEFIDRKPFSQDQYDGEFTGEGEEAEEEMAKEIFEKKRPSIYEEHERPVKKGKDGKWRTIDSHGWRGRKPEYKEKQASKQEGFNGE